jgi:hypothetical protein
MHESSTHEQRMRGCESGEEHGEEHAAATNMADAAKERGREALERGRGAAAGRLDGVVQALRRTADELGRDGDRAQLAGYVRQAASRLDGASRSLRERSVDDLLHQAESWAREQPALFAGAAVVAGFAFARFLKASSARTSVGSGGWMPRAGAGGSPAPGSYDTAATAGRPQPPETTAEI